MEQLEEARKAVEQIFLRQNDCWYDTKTIATAVYVILTHMIDADRKTEPTGYNLSPVDKDINVRSNSSEKPNNCEPQTDYGKGLQLFADILFDKEKSEQFLKECKAMGIEPQTVDLGNGFSITANGTKTPNYCATCRYKDTPFDDLPCDMCKSYSAYEPKDEPQTDCAWR